MVQTLVLQTRWKIFENRTTSWICAHCGLFIQVSNSHLVHYNNIVTRDSIHFSINVNSRCFIHVPRPLVVSFENTFWHPMFCERSKQIFCTQSLFDMVKKENIWTHLIKKSRELLSSITLLLLSGTVIGITKTPPKYGDWSVLLLSKFCVKFSNFFIWRSIPKQQ